MSLDTYANLKLEVIKWSHREDIDLMVDTFIDLAEAEMFANQIAPLKLRSAETRATASMDATTPSRYLALPIGYEEMRKLSVLIDDGENIELFYRTPAQLNVKSSVGMPNFFTVTSQLEFDREPDQAYTVEMQYLKKFTPLSSSNTTNFVLDDYPNIYLFGALWAENVYSEEETRAASFYSQFIAAIRGANKKAKKGQYGPAPVMRIEGVTP